MREEGFITDVAGAGGAARRASASGRIPARAIRAARLREGVPAAAFRERFGGDHPPDWQVRTTFVPDAAGRRRAGRAQRARPASTSPICRRRSWRSIRKPATSWRSSAGATSPQSQFNRASRSRRQPGSAFKPFLFAAALEHGYSPVSLIERADDDRAAGAGRVGAAERRWRDARRADAARGAARVEQPRGERAAAAGRDRGRCCGSRRTSGCANCPTCRRCRSAPASSRRSS